MDAMVCRAFEHYSERASTSAGIELMENQVMVLGNSAAWRSDVVIGHSVMQDAIDTGAVAAALRAVGIQPAMGLSDADAGRVAAVFAKAEPSRSGMIRGRRHVMLDDSDIHASPPRPARWSAACWREYSATPSYSSPGAPNTRGRMVAVRSP